MGRDQCSGKEMRVVAWVLHPPCQSVYYAYAKLPQIGTRRCLRRFSQLTHVAPARCRELIEQMLNKVALSFLRLVRRHRVINFPAPHPIFGFCDIDDRLEQGHSWVREFSLTDLAAPSSATPTTPNGQEADPCRDQGWPHEAARGEKPDGREARQAR